jgi:hypothetical protein
MPRRTPKTGADLQDVLADGPAEESHYLDFKKSLADKAHATGIGPTARAGTPTRERSLHATTSHGTCAMLRIGGFLHMIDAATEAVITGAAGNAVAYMLNGRLDALRVWTMRVFRHASSEQRAEVLRALEADSDSLGRQLASCEDVSERWAALLTSVLQAHPSVRDDVSALTWPPRATKASIVGSQNNYGTGTFVGGDNYGAINPGPTSGTP